MMSGPRGTERYLLRLGDPSIGRGEIEAWTETLYRELYGEPADVVAGGRTSRPAAILPGGRAGVSRTRRSTP